MTHAKTKERIIPTPWGPHKPGQGWVAGRKRGSNFKKFKKPDTPYAAGTRKKLLDRYLKILEFLEGRLSKEAGPITSIGMGEHMNLTAAATGITCDHLADYVARHGLEARKILVRILVRGTGICWEGKAEIGTGIDLIKQHIKQVPK